MDGTVAENSFHEEPIQFFIGDGTMIEGLESVLYGLKVGDRKKITLAYGDTFGEVDEDNVHTLTREEFSPDFDLAPRQIIGFTTPSGEEVPGTIVEVLEDEVIVDFNHPLAGHDLIFEFEILDIKLSEKPLH